VAEVIAVNGGPPDTLRITETIWGPVWGEDTQGRPLALRWTAHDPTAVNLALHGFETARDVDEMVALAGLVGIPPQNLVVADSSGRIAWTIAGRIPRRVGWDGRLPVSWADGAHRWDGFLDPAEQPRLVDPLEGLLWTANNRVTAGHDLVVLGDGGYGLGARARQIRDALRALERPVEADMLALQLDDRALMLAEWRDLLLPVLARQAESGTVDPGCAEFLRIVRDEWEGRADPASVSYRLVRNLVFTLIERVYDALTTPCREADEDFAPSWLPYRHAVTWELLSARPPHLLPPGAADWDAVVLAAVDTLVARATRGERSLADYTWGKHNTVQVAHPFARLVPRLARWLSAPPQALPGDSSLPRVQSRRAGASQRLVVSPGREQDGIFHMPGGQSGHPMSRYFLAGHDDWAEGRATPLLPGPAAHRLVLRPR
jgi:penicillin G amidase